MSEPLSCQDLKIMCKTGKTAATILNKLKAFIK